MGERNRMGDGEGMPDLSGWLITQKEGALNKHEKVTMIDYKLKVAS